MGYHWGRGRPSYSGREVISEVSSISIQELKALGCLQQGFSGYKYFTISRNGEQTGGFSIYVSIDNRYNSYIEFNYSVNGEPVKYRHDIEFFPCHYGNHRFYFICRDTGRRCTALYLVDGYFSSRFYHKMSYISSRYHRNYKDLVYRYQSMDAKAEALRRHGHPRKANELYWKARNIEDKSWNLVFKRLDIMAV